VKVRNQHDCKSLLGTIHLTIYDEYVKHDIIDLLIRKALVVIIYQYFLHTMFNILIFFKKNVQHSESFMGLTGISTLLTSTVGKSTNILWHDCPIGQNERQNLLNQKGCVVWITGLSGSGHHSLITPYLHVYKLNLLSL